MLPATLGEIASALSGQLLNVAAETPWTGGLQIDSREIQPGDLFLALPGSQHDGHEFVTSAFQQGAIAAITRRDQSTSISGPQLLVTDTQDALQALANWHRRRMDALLIGVTGSVGKTTTREMIHAILQHQHPGVRSRKNYNNEIGLPLSLLEIQTHHEFAVLEFGAARIGDIAHLTRLAPPEIGVITAIGAAHLKTFGSVTGIMQGKGELLEALPRGGFAVLSGDCPKLRSLTPRAACRVIHVGEQIDNDLRATAIEQSPTGLHFHCDGQRYHVPVLGRHNITNALCAIAIGKEIGIPAAQIAEGLAHLPPVAGRTQLKRIGPWTVIDDSYNASPTAFAAAVQTLCDLNLSPTSRKLVIAGDMLELGPAARAAHFELGQHIGQANIQRLLVIGEHADDVAEGALQAGLPPHRIAAAKDWNTLIFLLECWLEPGDWLLVKGSRGMRMERIIDWLTSYSTQITIRKSA